MVKLDRPLDESKIIAVQVDNGISPYVLAITDIIYDLDDYVECVETDYSKNKMSKPHKARIHYNGTEDYFVFGGTRHYMKDFMRVRQLG